MKLNTAVAICVLSFACGHSMAQGDAQKKELAAKIVALQQGAELDQLAQQLTGNAAAPMLQKWAPKLQSDVPEAKRKQVADKLNEELNKYREDLFAIIKSKADKVAADTLTPAYEERFTEDELKQLVTFFESPAVKKYQTVLPEILNLLIQKLVEVSGTEVQARTNAFDAAAAKIVSAEAPKKNPPKKK